MKRAADFQTTLLGRRVEVEVWSDPEDGPSPGNVNGEVVGAWLEREPGAQVASPTLLVAFDDLTLHCARLEDIVRVLPRPARDVVEEPEPDHPAIRADVDGLALRLGAVERDKFGAWFRSVVPSDAPEDQGVTWDQEAAAALLFALWEVAR